MKQGLFILATIMLLGFITPTHYVDPTGTYVYAGSTKKIKGDVYGYTGKIQVKKLSANKIVMTLEVNKGAPSYNSGSLDDTLVYKDNTAIYTDPGTDSTCKITFIFDIKGVSVKEETADFNFGCGFGHAVVADGFYRKISGKTPVFTDQ